MTGGRAGRRRPGGAAALLLGLALAGGAGGARPGARRGAAPGPTGQPGAPEHEVDLGGGATVRVWEAPFRLCVGRGQGAAWTAVQCTATSRSGGGGGPAVGWGRWVGAALQRFVYEGYSLRVGALLGWTHFLEVVSVEVGTGTVTVGLADTPGGAAQGRIEVASAGDAGTPVVSVDVSLADGRFNRVGVTLEAQDGEGFFGMGERFAAANHRGKRLYCWAEDGGWGFGLNLRLPKGPESTYMPVPFYISSRGHGVWLNTTRRTDWDFRPDVAGGVQWQVEGRAARMNVILGRTPKATLAKFVDLTGRPLVPPAFQFGPWNQFGNEFPRTPKDPLVEVGKFRALDIPSSVAVIPNHFTPDGLTRKENLELPPLLANLSAQGLPALGYFNSMISSRYKEAYAAAKAQGLFVMKRDGTPWVFHYKGAGWRPFAVSMLDFTHPGTAPFYEAMFRNATGMGFNGWMYDYGEYVDPDMLFHDGSRGAEAHNRYPVQYQRAGFDFFTRPDARAGVRPAPGDGYAPPHIFYVRSGYTGTGGATWATWTGDPSSDWTAESGIKAQLTASLTAGLAGVPFSGSDIGGFLWLRPPSVELWCRWAQLGALSGIMHTQTGGTSLLGLAKSHVHDTAEGSRIYRRWAKFRTALFPYLYGAAHEARRYGLPLMRHHLLSFPGDPEALEQPYQYMLGANLLCAPVLDKGRRKQTVYLPRGADWVDWGAAARYDERDGRFRVGHAAPLPGGQYVEAAAGLEAAPLFVRAASVIFTVDPSVQTLAEASDPAVVDLRARAGVLHAWAFLDGSLRAGGESWDGAAVGVEPDAGAGAAGGAPGAPLSLKVFIEDRLRRAVILQIPLPPGLPDVDVRGLDGASIPRRASWEEVARVPAAAGAGAAGDPAWAFDAELGAVWIRSAGGARAPAAMAAQLVAGRARGPLGPAL